MKLLRRAALVAVSALVALRAPGPAAADERIAQTDPKQDFPRWLPQIRAEGAQSPFGVPVEFLQAVHSPSIAVDSQGVLHLVFVGYVPGLFFPAPPPPDRPPGEPSGEAPPPTIPPGGIFYTHNRWENRRSNSWATPALISGFPSEPGDNAGEPDIAVGPDDKVHIVWTQKWRYITHGTVDWSTGAPVIGAPESTPLDGHDMPAIAIDPANTWYLVARCWKDCDPTRIHYSKGTPATGWQPKEEVPGSERGTRPRVSFDKHSGAYRPGVAWVEQMATNAVWNRRGPGGWPGTAHTISGPGVHNVDLSCFSESPLMQFAWDQAPADPLTIKWARVVGGAEWPPTLSAAENVAMDGGERPRIQVDSRQQAHINWTRPDSISYGHRANRPSLDTAEWGRQEPTTAINRRAQLRLETAVDANDNVHLTFDDGVFFGGQQFVAGAVYTSRMLEANLGMQDAAVMFGFGPNAVGNAANGNLFFQSPLFSCRGVGFAAMVTLYYNSMHWDPGVMSRGWTHSYHISQTDHKDNGVISLLLADGRTVIYRPHPSFPGNTLAEDDFGEFSRWQDEVTLKTKHGIRFEFDAATGKPVKFLDTSLNELKLEYLPNPQGANGLLHFVKDSSNRVVEFLYDEGRLASIKDPALRSYAIEYTNKRVSKVSLPGIDWQFTYHTEHNTTGKRKNLLDALTTPRGNATKFRWDPDNRLRDSQDPSVSPASIGPHGTRAFSHVSEGGGGSATNKPIFTNRRGNETKLEVEYKRSLATKITDAHTHSVLREFDGTYRVPLAAKWWVWAG
jgi:hypothetical protein